MISKNLNIGWLGYHIEGVLALDEILQSGLKISAILTLDQEGRSRRSAVADFSKISDKYDIPLYEISNINSKVAIDLLLSLNLDILFVIGWSQILSPPVLSCLKIGAIGAHASLLPENRGSAPINWALIKGFKFTGNSLIWLDARVDEGDILYQEKIEITPFDTCKTLYEKVAITNRCMVMKVLKDFQLGIFSRSPQKSKNTPILPRRKPSDGKVNWEQSAADLYDFIRALVKPYPGAFFTTETKQVIIWDASIIDLKYSSSHPAGTVIDHLIGPTKCGILVQCGSDSIIILFELEISGSNEPLTGKRLLKCFPIGRSLD